MNDTRQRLVDASAALLQRQGLTGTGIKQILAEAQAPFSSLYHHFPGGKEELATAAIRASGARYQALVEGVWDEAPDVISSVAAVFEGAAETLEATDFAVACPIATVALEVASTNEPLRLATAEVFDSWIASGGGALRGRKDFAGGCPRAGAHGHRAARRSLCPQSGPEVRRAGALCRCDRHRGRPERPRSAGENAAHPST